MSIYRRQGRATRYSGVSPATFYCDNVQRTCEELVSRGVEFVAPPKKEPWGTFTMLRDPDGNQFVLSSK